MKTSTLLATTVAALALAGLSLVRAAEPLKLEVTPERRLVHKPTTREVIVLVEVRATDVVPTKRAPMNLAIVLDRSGSMAGAKIEKARQAAALAVERLADGDIVSVVQYDNTAQVLVPPQRVANAGNRREIRDRIFRIQPGGGTALYAGVSLGAEQACRFIEDNRVNRVMLMSDGLANVGPSSTADLASLGKRLSDEKLAVTTIGLGDDYNEDLMASLAESSRANYYYVKDTEKLPEIFAKEVGAAAAVVAKSIKIKITCPEGVVFKGVVGMPEIKAVNGVAVFDAGEAAAGETRKLLVRCEVPESAEGKQPVLGASLEYAADGTNHVTTAATGVEITAEADKLERTAVPAVLQEHALQMNRIAKEQAIALADAGKPAEAAKVLESQCAYNTSLPAAAQFKSIQTENDLLLRRAKELSTTGELSKGTRKATQWENWADKNQKR